MANYVGLLRAVNLAGRNTISSAALKDLFVSSGASDVRVLLQSGNAVFQSHRRSTSQLEESIERAAARTLGLQTCCFVRSAAEVHAVVAANPFPKEAERDPARLVVVFLKASPNRAAATALTDAIVGREVARTDGRHAYVVYPDGIGRSRLTAVLIEKHLGTRGTARNWNTVLKLAALVDQK